MSQGGVNINPFLMFDGKAEAAMQLYISLFPDSKIKQIEKYGADEGGPEGSVKLATFQVGGREVMCIDSPIAHEFTFTPSFSFFVTCEDESQIDQCFEALAADGQVLMPLDAYPFSAKFGWVQDRFGISWQLTLGPQA